MLLHHSVGEPTPMQETYHHITVAKILLDDPAKAPERIDNAPAHCPSEERLLFIETPTDMVVKPRADPSPFITPG